MPTPLLRALALIAAGVAGTCSNLWAANEPPLLPLQTFFANPQHSWDYRVSPDGTGLAWIALREGRATLHFRKLEDGAVKTVETPREARPPFGGSSSYWWSRDGRRLLFLMDRNGDENTHLYSVEVDAPDSVARDLTPLDNTRVEFVRTIRTDPNVVLVRHNGRNGRLFDVYRLNLTTAELTLLAENPGNVFAGGFSSNSFGVVRSRFRNAPGGGWVMEVRDRAEQWREIARGVYGDHMRVLAYSGPNYAWVLSNRGRDRVALVRLNLRTGAEDLIYEHPLVDVEGGSINEAGKLRFIWYWPGFKDFRFYDAELQADLTPFLTRERTALSIHSIDLQERWLTLSVDSDRGDQQTYLLDRRSGTSMLLAQSPMAQHREHLAAMEPISFTARDGMTIHGLLTAPGGASGRTPMVLLVHGGPWARDKWGYNGVVQFLANRGYTVLQVNYRGSTEYGRSYLLAGTREFSRKMLYDLIDGVRLAVERGVADPERVAIMGASYGGYSALSGLAFAPEVFAAGINRVGIADMVSLIENWPQYWRVEREWWARFFGDASDPSDRQTMAERSPINRVEAIRAPLLVVQGANDVRVKRDHSDRIVEALRARNHDVEYLVFPDEGHGINRTANLLTYMRAVERFLARTVGGRDGGEPEAGGANTDVSAAGR